MRNSKRRRRRREGKKKLRNGGTSVNKRKIDDSQEIQVKSFLIRAFFFPEVAYVVTSKTLFSPSPPASAVCVVTS